MNPPVDDVKIRVLGLGRFRSLESICYPVQLSGGLILKCSGGSDGFRHYKPLQSGEGRTPKHFSPAISHGAF